MLIGKENLVLFIEKTNMWLLLFLNKYADIVVRYIVDDVDERIHEHEN